MVNGRVASLNFGPNHFSAFNRLSLRPSPYHEYEFVNDPPENYKIKYIPPSQVDASQTQFYSSPYIDANSQYQGVKNTPDEGQTDNIKIEAQAAAQASLKAGAQMAAIDDGSTTYVTPNGTKINVPPGFHVRGPPYENGIGLLGGGFDDKNNPVLVNSKTGQVLNAGSFEKWFGGANSTVRYGIKSIGPAVGGIVGGALGSYAGPYGTFFGAAGGEAAASAILNAESENYTEPIYH